MNAERRLIEDRVFKFIEDNLGITREQIKSKSRKRPIVQARQKFCWYLYVKHRNLYSLHKIGTVIGRDHSTVNHALDTIWNELDYEKDFVKLPLNRETTNFLDLLDVYVKSDPVKLTFTRFNIEAMVGRDKIENCNVCQL
jgi:chromosomal replication initiation ATPase DnaA